MISLSSYRKSQSFQWQKLAVADEFGQRRDGGDEAKDHNRRDIFKNRFAVATAGQFWAMFRYEMFRPSLSGSLTVAVLFFCFTFMAVFYRHSSFQTQNVSSFVLYFIDLLKRLNCLAGNVAGLPHHVPGARAGYRLG